MTDRISTIRARCEAKGNRYKYPTAGDAWQAFNYDIPYLLGHIEKLCEGCEIARRDFELSQSREYADRSVMLDKIHKLLSQLAERDRTIERLREAIASVHKSLDFADGQRQSCKNYTELAINNGLALGRIAVTLKHDFKEPLPAPPEEGEVHA